MPMLPYLLPRITLAGAYLAALLLTGSGRSVSGLVNTASAADQSLPVTDFPDEEGPYRLYLNSPDSGRTINGRIDQLGRPVPGSEIPIPDAKLDVKKQKTPKTLLSPQTKQEYSNSWMGEIPFDVNANQIEVWIRVDTNIAEKKSSKEIELKMRLQVENKTIGEHSVEVPGKYFVKGKDAKLQVLARWPVENLALTKGANLSIDFASTNDGDFSVFGYGLSHIEFRNDPKMPNPHQALYTIASDKDSPGTKKPDKPKPGSAAKPKLPLPPKEAVPGGAAAKLKLAKDLIKNGKTSAAKKRLESIIQEFDGTDAAKEAADLLDDLE